MSVEFKTLKCPQCGSVNVSVVTDSVGVCSSCGAKFIITSDNANKNYDYLIVRQLNPEYSQEEFIRKIWISIAGSQVNPDIFDSNISPVLKHMYELYSEDLNAYVSYSAQAGIVKSEPYISYEYYTENEPYVTDGETYYRKVTKQRPVTQYQNVKNYTSVSGNMNAVSCVLLDVNKSGFLTKNFYYDYNYIGERLFVPVADFDFRRISKINRESIEKEHSSNIKHYVHDSISCDHLKDLRVNLIHVNSKKSAFSYIPMYSAKLNYKGNYSEFSAFPFGSMTVDSRLNTGFYDSETENRSIRNDVNKRIKERADEVSKRVFDKTFVLTLIVIALLLGSVAVSLFVHSVFAASAMFLTALSMTVVECILKHNINKAILSENNALNNSDIDEANLRINEIREKYKAEKLNRLNAKLSSLNLKPASREEVFGGFIK